MGAGVHACRLELLPEGDVLLRLMLDCPVLRGAEEPELLSALAEQGLRLEAGEEDETRILTLRRVPARREGET